MFLEQISLGMNLWFWFHEAVDDEVFNICHINENAVFYKTKGNASVKIKDVNHSSKTMKTIAILSM